MNISNVSVLVRFYYFFITIDKQIITMYNITYLLYGGVIRCQLSFLIVKELDVA